MKRTGLHLFLSAALLIGSGCQLKVDTNLNCIPGLSTDTTVAVSGSVNQVLHGCGTGDGGVGTGGNGGGSAAGGSGSAGGNGGTGGSGGSDGGVAGNGGGGGGSAGGSGTAGGGGSSAGGGGTTTSSGDVPPAATRGATVPYWEYEAESATTTGTKIGPSTTFGDVAAEASGRQAVRLDSVGQKVTFTLAHPANSIVVRYSIPDANQTTAADPVPATPTSTLGLYVNGVRKASLTMTSRYSWTYGDADAQGSGSNTAGNGMAHHYYDEAHLLFDSVPAGATIALQKDSQDNAAYYVIDLVDFEAVGAPLAQPAGSLSLTDFGAVANDGNDDGPALQSAINAAKTQNKVLFIPSGVFDIRFDATTDVTKRNVSTSGVTIRGAGMWYSVLSGFGAQLKLSGTNNNFSDFALFGDVTLRDDTKGYQGFDGPLGTNAKVQNLWIEHETVGMWVGHGATLPPINAPLTTGLIVQNVRIRDTYADGINLANATSNAVIQQNTLRNTGDDSLATWSYAGDGPVPCSNNVFKFNTVQTTWRATCMAIYGGSNISFTDNLCADTSNYPGILVSSTAGFQPLPFTGTQLVERNTLTRAGGEHYGYDHGALKFFADLNPISGVTVSDIEIDNPPLNGIQFEGSRPMTGITFSGITIGNPGTVGMWVTGGVTGNVAANGIAITGAATGLKNDSPSTFVFTKGAGNSGW